MSDDDSEVTNVFGQIELLSTNSPEALIPDGPRRGLTIGTLMVGVAVAACLFALPGGLDIAGIVLCIPLLCIIAVQTTVPRRHARVAASCFWIVATLINVLIAWSCIAPGQTSLTLVFLGSLFVAIPLIAACGIAWIAQLGQRVDVPPRSREVAGISVFLLSALPILTLWTLWPLRMAFVTSRPALERLADQVAVGNIGHFPQRAGCFQINGAGVNAISGDVALMIDPNPSGPTGFVRNGRAAFSGPNCPIAGSDLTIDIGGGWSYREDD